MNSIHLQQTLPQVFADRNSVTSDVWHQDLIFRKGEMYLIEAASGTGKSSLCSYLYGYRNDYQGIINFDEAMGRPEKAFTEYAFSRLAYLHRTHSARKRTTEE